ncbi:S9 family peptidase [Lentibacillus salinarum]|uniref:S9 family peptidase n=1 Tax=Lentibacillus salinarum TaxID=446820 RepID=A0ABW3ZSU4_9BACI
MNDKAKQALTAKDLKKINVYSDPQFTPDGHGYTFVSTAANDDNDYTSHVFFQALNDQKATQWTFADAQNSHPRFSPDGQNVVFQSTRTGIPQLWLLHTDGGEAKQLTTFKHGAGNPEWSKDGQSIIFSAPLEEADDANDQQEPNEEERQKEKEKKRKQPLVINRLKYKSDASGFHDAKRTQIIRYDVANETFEQLTSAYTDHHFEDISPDDQQLLFSANLSEDRDYELTNDLYLLDLATKNITTLTNGKGQYGNARFSPSGGKIACLGHDFAYQGATLNELFVFDAETGDRSCLSHVWDIQLGDAMIGDTRMGQSENGPVWHEDEAHLFFIATDFGATGIYQASLDGDLTVMYKENSHVFGFSYHEGTFILGISTPTNPGNFYQLDKKGHISRLTDANRAFLDEVALSEPETLTFEADDGWEIQGWLLRPYGFEEGKKYPFVLEVHGGPHAMYGQTFFHEMQLLAAKGYVVLYTNPRGSHGYGQAFVDACRTDYGGKDYTDLMSAVDDVLETYDFIDEERLGVTGGSYGGFMTNWIIGHTNRFKAAVTQRCISNWLSFYGVSDIGYFFTKWELGKNLLEDPAQLWDFSPLKYAENMETPLLIVHGENDYRCPIEQSEQLFVTLKHMKKDVEFVRFPDANHELSRSGKPEMRIERLNHITRWFEQYL